MVATDPIIPLPGSGMIENRQPKSDEPPFFDNPHGINRLLRTTHKALYFKDLP